MKKIKPMDRVVNGGGVPEGRCWRGFGLPAMVWVAACAAFSASTGSFAGSFLPLGDLPGSAFSSGAADVSADGSVVVGYGIVENLYQEPTLQAFRWTSSSGMAALGHLPGRTLSSSYATGVSADGNVIVGADRNLSLASAPHEAYRWTSGTGMVGLGYLPGGGWSSYANDVTPDGSVVVGASIGTSGSEAFRWASDDGMVGLGHLTGGTSSNANGVSADGNVVVGISATTLGMEAFYWTGSGGMVGLGDLAGGDFNSEAYAVSANGAVVVGRGISASGQEAFRWTSIEGMVGLGDLLGDRFGSTAYDVSADGNVIVGSGTAHCFGEIWCQEAFLWTSSNGMQRLFDVLVAGGVTGLSGWKLVSAEGISADGQWVVGWGFNPAGRPEAYLANVAPVPLPATIWMLGGALGAVGWLKRRAAA